MKKLYRIRGSDGRFYHKRTGSSPAQWHASESMTSLFSKQGLAQVKEQLKRYKYKIEEFDLSPVRPQDELNLDGILPEKTQQNIALQKHYPLGMITAVCAILEDLRGYIDPEHQDLWTKVHDSLDNLDEAIRTKRYPL